MEQPPLEPYLHFVTFEKTQREQKHPESIKDFLQEKRQKNQDYIVDQITFGKYRREHKHSEFLEDVLEERLQRSQGMVMEQFIFEKTQREHTHLEQTPITEKDNKESTLSASASVSGDGEVMRVLLEMQKQMQKQNEEMQSKIEKQNADMQAKLESLEAIKAQNEDIKSKLQSLEDIKSELQSLEDIKSEVFVLNTLCERERRLRMRPKRSPLNRAWSRCPVIIVSSTSIT